MHVIQNIIRLAPFFITLFWGLIFIIQPVKKNRARFTLGIFMFSASILYFSHALFFEGDYTMYLKMDWVYALAGLSVYPLYYLYVRLMTRDIRFHWHYLWHLMPAIITVALLEIFLSHVTQQEKISYLNSVLIHRTWPQETTHSFLTLAAALFFISRIIFGLQAIIYTVMALWFIRKYNQRLANFFSNPAEKKLVWLELLTISLIVASIASIILDILGRSFFIQKHSLLVPSLLFSTLFFIIGMLGNLQHYSISGLVREEKEEEHFPEQNRDEKLLKNQLLSFMEKEQPYLDSNLRINTLSQKLFTNRTYLSNLINNELKMSFSDFINQYRIKYAKTLMENKKGNVVSMKLFAEQSGFGSVSSFLRAFKQFEKTSAGNYYKQPKR